MMEDQNAIPDYYRFYEQVNKNGQKYDIAIDNAIINHLNVSETNSSGQLKLAAEQSVGRVLSPDTFYGHRDVLIDCKMLAKTDRGRGRDVLYSLTDNAKKLLQLNLLGDNWERIRLFNKIYERFSYLNYLMTRAWFSEQRKNLIHSCPTLESNVTTLSGEQFPQQIMVTA